MSDFTVTAAGAEHMEQIAELEKLCFSEPWSLASLTACCNDTSYIFFAALKQGSLAGYASFRYILDEAEICNIAVYPKYRRQGAAGRLLGEVIKAAAELKLKKIHLEVRADNAEAISLYEKYGFIRSGIRSGFYEKPREDAILMTREISENI